MEEVQGEIQETLPSHPISAGFQSTFPLRLEMKNILWDRVSWSRAVPARCSVISSSASFPSHFLALHVLTQSPVVSLKRNPIVWADSTHPSEQLGPMETQWELYI